jgi:hypothetical protein
MKKRATPKKIAKTKPLAEDAAKKRLMSLPAGLRLPDKKILLNELLSPSLFLISGLLTMLFYVFGGYESLVNKNQDIYKELITASFSLGVAIAAIAISKGKEIAKRLILPAILLILGGLMMYANLAIGEFSRFSIDFTQNAMAYVFLMYLLIGGVGIMFFFFGITRLVVELVRIYHKT